MLPLLIWGNSLLATPKDTDIQIVYHIATMNNWEDIVWEQLHRVQQSGLGDACRRMTITVVGPQVDKVHQIVKHFDFSNKMNIIHAGNALNAYEFPGIEMVQKIATKKPHCKILYMHTKGVTHYQKPSEQPVRCWRRYMEYFTIDKWKRCIRALETANICGVDYTRSIHGHYFFAGNFWWSTAAYAATCELRRNTRFDCEDFIGRGVGPVAKSFHQSGENPQVINKYSREKFPDYYFFTPSSPYHKGIMNLYAFSYLEEYYKTD